MAEVQHQIFMAGDLALRDQHMEVYNEVDPDVEELLKRLQQRREAAQQAAAFAPQARMPFAGDRGMLSQEGTSLAHLHPSQLAPTRPASPSPSSIGMPAPDLHPGDLPKEVAAREVELRVLRSEVEARETEAGKLREHLRDAELALQRASGAVGSLSAKVEATSGSRHSVLEASAQQVDTQVVALRRRLSRMETVLAQKEDEVVALRQALDMGTRSVEDRHAMLQALHRSHAEHGQRANEHEEDKNRLHRHRAIQDWRERVHAQLAREELDASFGRERQETERQIEALDEDIQTFKTFIHRMEEKSKHHSGESRKLQQQFDGLVMEERLCHSALRMGHETAKEQKQHVIDEHRALETRILEEQSRKAAKAPHAAAYDESEAEAIKHQVELAALIACTREASRAMQRPHPGRHHLGAPRMPLTADFPPTATLGSMHHLVAPLSVGSASMLQC